jgi:hypothetical protein
MLHEPLHAVTVSVGYGADYLDIALSHNRPHVDTYVVATDPADMDSQRVALRHGCQLVLSEDHKRGDGIRSFAKGAMIDRALQQLPADGWRLHIDADCVLPGNVRQRLGLALTDRRCLYGCDRINVVGEAAWDRLQMSGWTTRGFQHHHYLNYPIDRNEVGGRLIHYDQGYVPVGFFQLWHGSAEFSGHSRIRPYPSGSNSAAHDDVQFALRWDRKLRVLIPEFFVAHLLTEDAKYGANWKGRRTRRFGRKPIADREGSPSPC